MTYDHRCDECKLEFEVERSMLDDTPVPCPRCSAAKTTRLILGGSGFILKGDHWAKDGYSDKEEKP